MSSFQNKPRKGAVKNFLLPCITCYLLLPQMQGNMIASFWEIIKSKLILWLRTVFQHSWKVFLFLTKKVNLLFFHLASEVNGRIAEMPQFAVHFLCFIMNSIHTGSNFPFAAASLPHRLLSVPQNRCRVSCDWRGFFPSVGPGHLPNYSVHWKRACWIHATSKMVAVKSL